MHGTIEIDLPGGQYQGKDLESAYSGARILGKLEPILLLGFEFQFPGLQSVRKKFVRRKEVRTEEKNTKRYLLGQEICRLKPMQ